LPLEIGEKSRIENRGGLIALELAAFNRHSGVEGLLAIYGYVRARVRTRSIATWAKWPVKRKARDS
jgi:hypothetical protein